MEERNDPGGVVSGAAADPDPESQAIRSAFERGDFAETARIARALLTRADLPEAARQEAQRLLAALAPDPLAKYFGVGCLLLFIGVVYFSLFR